MRLILPSISSGSLSLVQAMLVGGAVLETQMSVRASPDETRRNVFTYGARAPEEVNQLYTYDIVS